MFPAVLKRQIEASRPGATVSVVPLHFFHPAELPRVTRAAKKLAPAVAVVEVVGWLAVKGRAAVDLSRLPRGVRSAYDRMRHFRTVSHAVLSKIPAGAKLVYGVQATAYEAAEGVLGALVPRLPRVTMEEYEQLFDESLVALKDSGVRVVVQGPMAPNLDIEATRQHPTSLIERYRATREIARRLAHDHELLFIDRWDTLGAGFYLPGDARPSARGHAIIGNLLAEELLRAQLV